MPILMMTIWKKSDKVINLHRDFEVKNMGKLILVSGENSSGKSIFAENLLAKCDKNLYYIATMIPKTEDNYERIEKHRKQRIGLGFTTLELPYSLAEKYIELDSAVLLEDVSNLLANNIFEKGKSVDEVFEDILNLTEKCKILIAVTISGLGNLGYDNDTAIYINSINVINKKLHDEALVSIKMINGEPIYEKGDENDIY